MKFLIVSLFAMIAALAGAEEVVVYTAHDEMYSRPILDRFEDRTGISVRAAYDTEASKTTGLVNRILAEQNRPRCDVFWNNEVAQTIVLQEKGALAPYVPNGADAIPAKFKDPDGYWTGFGARARVIIYNTDMVKTPPTSILDLLAPEWRGKTAIALPLFGTTATHSAALFAVWGDDKAKTFFHDLQANDVAILPGNAQVRDMVASGHYAWGLTDTDDANGAVEDGKPAKWLLPDQGEGEMGTLLIPNTVALIKGAPNTEAAKKLIDFLISPEVELALAKTRSIQIPLNPAVDAPENVPAIEDIKTTDVSFEAAASALPRSMAFIRETFAR